MVIDVIIKNQAQFTQPYPDVQLNFEDINGEPVAGRRFAPSEYISDKTIPLDSMPSDTPIHLTLEIEEFGQPGDRVNPEMHLVVSTQSKLVTNTIKKVIEPGYRLKTTGEVIIKTLVEL
ncbi:MAG: DUF3426 domain-containing protein [Planctomycetes bacterium]|nr:DUF3426 domain-containing protein [Planctomycetota bacterium]